MTKELLTWVSIWSDNEETMDQGQVTNQDELDPVITPDRASSDYSSDIQPSHSGTEINQWTKGFTSFTLDKLMLRNLVIETNEGTSLGTGYNSVNRPDVDTVHISAAMAVFFLEYETQ
ncbi:4005_t:CDS:2 [Acaulospora colombiana]|uniref:4005_t:CDS:1 n=1 Tax=Acaulospora colombiana TaxID=27376 RepID=A0ACA9NIB1_9GLOM|nr:4005_t:CDS:2 [Acaulospora colombiana]